LLLGCGPLGSIFQVFVAVATRTKKAGAGSRGASPRSLAPLGNDLTVSR
jgi:hypothetical protein